VVLYDYPTSPNCMKVRILLGHLRLPHERVTVDMFRGEARTPVYLARNPDGRVPALELDDGTTIAESGAILLYLAEGSPYLPDHPVARARVHQWMFFEQNRVEPELAVARFLMITGRSRRLPRAVVDHRRERGRDALRALDRGLGDGRPFVAGPDYTVADIALYACVHCAGEAGVEPREHGTVAAWLDRVEAQPGFVNDLAPMPSHALDRPSRPNGRSG
jgi:glutathione S-transferase